MKKLISILLLIVFLSSNFSFACKFDSECTPGIEICKITPPLPEGVCVSSLTTNQSTTTQTTQECTTPCTDGKQCVCTPNGCSCEASTTQTTTDKTSPTSVMGIDCDETKLVNGQCKLNIYDTLGIRKSVRNPGDATSVGLFVQDVILSATFFIGTLVTIALVVSGLMFIFAASSGKDPANAKKGIMGSLIGLLIVVSSYVIIRLVQYIAKGF